MAKNMTSENPMSEIRIGDVTAKWARNNHLHVEYKAQTESTNATAKELAFEEDLLEQALCLFITDQQTAGRGRGKNTWTTDQVGSALLSSWSYLLPIMPQPTASCLVGLAVYRACSTTWPFLKWNLKAPNDIYIGDKKVAGILLENVAQGDEVRFIIGLGVNITSSPESVETSTSVLESLPEGAPLLGEDYTGFLDRLAFELSDAASHCDQPLSPTEQLSLLTALNLHPLLKEKYTAMEADGSLYMGAKKISWADL
ncbi:biotin--[acetyl-CoA-carboxylase] ligase [Bdellovibrio sp. SKB1291214]|uniref:biotin--[acetyl-CoA-carboxylase] ligase n=1 Tax=Bdellovibrio sp. SKB1291214 TaxID=1732569 RepID=UPI0020CC95E3|nr:biotin--[acetyl-CoA-carboxylase] ligase [Bdellovibrio sp. SKB1291214]UYL07485.1 biotin--[acetyl-CoA-carboxylase] ligase [Bdellovibrio sp. SKB1291214]